MSAKRKIKRDTVVGRKSIEKFKQQNKKGNARSVDQTCPVTLDKSSRPRSDSEKAIEVCHIATLIAAMPLFE